MSKKVTYFSITYFLTIIIMSWNLKFFASFALCFAYDLAARILLACIIAFYTLPTVKRFVFNRKVSPQKKAVLITGCDYGIGHILAKRLDSKGFKVFAGCFFPIGYGARTLKESCSETLHVFRLDVTKDTNIKKAVNYVKKNLDDSALWAVINNAGVRVLRGFDVELTKTADFQEIMDFYAMSVVRVTKAFLPLLRSSKGRVVTITSFAGRISIPSLSAYCMSNFAVSCFCKCLRQELLPCEVKLIIVEPNFFKTPTADYNLIQSKLDNAWLNPDKNTEDEYWINYFKEYRKARKQSLKICSSRLHKVVDSLEDSITLEEPCNVYRPSQNIFMQLVFSAEEFLPTSIAEEISSDECFVLAVKPVWPGLSGGFRKQYGNTCSIVLNSTVI